MEKEEILQKAKNKKVFVGEMEKNKINKSNWIAVIITSLVAVAFIISESALSHRPAAFAIAAICFAWASSFYFCQYFLAKRPWQVLMGAILELIGALIMITNYILCNVGVI